MLLFEKLFEKEATAFTGGKRGGTPNHPRLGQKGVIGESPAQVNVRF